MWWLKRDLWKAGIAFVGILLLLMAIAGRSVSAAGIYEEKAGLAGPGTVTVQVTPTEDATVTTLNKEKLAQEVQQLKNQNEPSLLDWLRGNISILLLGLGALAGFLRWLADRRDAQDKELQDRQAEREKRAEERFQAAVEGLSSEREEAKIGAAILLRTFLRPGYEQFYTQVFDLAVAHLCLPRTSNLLKGPNAETPNLPEGTNTPLQLTTLWKALIVVFKEAFPLARNELLKEQGAQIRFRSLDATGVQLDGAYLVEADLKQVWMREASLREANLYKADLSEANLRRADLSKASLVLADLSGAKLTRTKIVEADLSGAKLWGVNLSRANLSKTNIEEAYLKDTDLRGVKGLTKEQLEACKAQGAIIDEAP